MLKSDGFAVAVVPQRVLSRIMSSSVLSMSSETLRYADPLEATNFMFIEDFTPWVMVPMIDSAGFADGTCEVRTHGRCWYNFMLHIALVD